jgi:acetyl esterase/lipase
VSRPYTAARFAYLGLAALTAAFASPARTARSAEAPADGVRIVKDVAYYKGPGADKTRHRLDLYLPKEAKDCPVLFFVHGGAWTHGDKDWLGRHKPVGVYWARQGYVVVMANYRLSPAVKHPGHIEDVARAFAWTHRNIARYGGRPDRIFLWGHSAGGHLVALLATDDRYLKTEGLDLRDVQGVICMSGMYHVPEKNTAFDSIFGAGVENHKAASPLYHVGRHEPPFLILCADHDLVLCGKKPAEEFCRALRARKDRVEFHEIQGTNHVGLLWRAHRSDDPAVRAMTAFLNEQIHARHVGGNDSHTVSMP